MLAKISLNLVILPLKVQVVPAETTRTIRIASTSACSGDKSNHFSAANKKRIVGKN